MIDIKLLLTIMLALYFYDGIKILAKAIIRAIYKQYKNDVSFNENKRSVVCEKCNNTHLVNVNTTGAFYCTCGKLNYFSA